MSFIIFVFAVSAGLLIYVYIGFPAILALLSRFMPDRNAEASGVTLNASMIIAAYNEEKYIKQKIENALSQTYPKQNLQIVVVSDGSSDNTNHIINSFSESNLTSILLEERNGKAHALNKGMELTQGEVTIFTDANVILEKNAIQKLLGPFSDPECGAVSGKIELKALETGEPLGEGAYMKYERFIQSSESKVYSMVGTDGALFAVRSKLVDEVPDSVVLDDFYIVMKVLEKGYRVFYEPEAKATELVPASVSQEFRRKTRIAAGCFQVLAYLSFIKHPFENIKLTFLFLSHKLLRWLSPFFMLATLFSTILLVGIPFFQVMLYLQILFYGLALLGALNSSFRSMLIIYIPYYFTAINVAFLVGFWRYLTKHQQVTWNRVDR